MGTYKRLLTYIKPYLKTIIVGLVFNVLAQASTAGVPLIIKNFLDYAIKPGQPIAYLYYTVGGLMALMVTRALFSFLQSILMSMAAQRFIVDLREMMYRKIQSLSLAYFEKRKTGNIMSNLTNDVSALQSAIVDNLVVLVAEGFNLFACVFMVFFLNWRLALVVFITAPVIAVIFNVLGKKTRSAGRVAQESIAEVTSVLQESIAAVRVVKSYVREDYEIARFTKENESNFVALMRAIKYSAVMSPCVECLASTGVALVVWYGGMQVIHGQSTTGSLIAFVMYAALVANPIKRVSSAYSAILRALGAADRIFEVLDEQPDIIDRPDAISMPILQGRISLDKVCFEYDKNEQVLCDVSLDVMPGQVVALVGPSGAGKSTIANIIPRFYDVSAGSVKVDGVDVRELAVKSLREQIGIVPQENILFHGTIYDNIRYGRLEATSEEIYEAAKIANAHAFIMDQPNGYQTIVGERGSTLSGGQRQRVAIARAVLKDPRVLILDEATSALDSESERLVQDALEKLMIGRTSIVIAHRLSTIKKANLIVVMQDGRIVEQGTHAQLLALQGLYTRLNSTQFVEDVNANDI